MPILSPNRCLVIGEVAQAHDGSLGTAHAFIDAIASAGADAVKFQTHIAHAESTTAEPWRIKFSPQDEIRFDYWKRMEFTEEQWLGLKRHAEEAGLLFLSSPFSDEAVDLLIRVGVAAWKVASGEVSNLQLLEKMAATGLPCILSTGMNSFDEIDNAVSVIQECGAPICVLQCTTAYPCPPERIGLNVMEQFRQRYGCAVGLSDHSGTIFPGFAAATLGANVVEVHVTLSRQSFGPDVPASVTTSELTQLVEGIRFIEAMNNHPVDKEEIAADLATLRITFGKSIVARDDIAPQTLLLAEHLVCKKPGTGIPASQLTRVIGRRVKHAIPADTLLQESDLC